MDRRPSRRAVLASAAAGATIGAASYVPAAAEEFVDADWTTRSRVDPPPRQIAPLKRVIGIPSRHFQWTSMEETVDLAKRAGFDAIEWTVRAGAHIEPANVARDLPRAVELTRKAGMSAEMAATLVQDADTPHAEAIVAALKGLGISHYRSSGYFAYDRDRDMGAQLEALKPRIASIAALNAKYGTKICYNNNSSAGDVGASIFDLLAVLKGFDPQHVGLDYDTGHATIRGGVEGWADGAAAARPYLHALAVKDFVWGRGDPAVVEAQIWRPRWKPLGYGMVSLKDMLTYLAVTRWQGPINIQYEYFGLIGAPVGQMTIALDREQFVRAIRHDLQYLRAVMKETRFA